MSTNLTLRDFDVFVPDEGDWKKVATIKARTHLFAARKAIEDLAVGSLTYSQPLITKPDSEVENGYIYVTEGGAKVKVVG